MKEIDETHIWKVRTIKNYPEAHNHLLVGRVLETTDSYVRLHCRSFHFGQIVRQPEDVKIGSVCVRVVPWSRVEIVNELPKTFDYIKNTLIAPDEGQVLFSDGKNSEPIGTAGTYEVSY
ncbi:hypothetical protein ACFL6U_24525 [Planctomycetota bacterium]